MLSPSPRRVNDRSRSWHGRTSRVLTSDDREPR